MCLTMLFFFNIYENSISKKNVILSEIKHLILFNFLLNVLVYNEFKEN